jgi:putative NADPH-quinone reductase
MGMPAWIYRWFFGAHSLKSLKRNVLSFVGFSPVRHCLIGMIEAKDPSGRQRWLQKLLVLGRDGR